MPMDPPIRVGPSIAPVTPVNPTIVLDGRLTPGSLSLGQEVGARVLSDRADGRFVAMLDGRPVEVVLPRGARSGDSVRLVVTAEQPRLVLSAQAEPEAGTGASRAAGAQAGRAAVEATGRPVQGASDVSVSAGGRALSRLVADISAAAAREAGGATADADGPQAARAPLVALPADGRAALAGQIAAALARTFAGSGLFYESHQAQWVAGERSLDSLRQEPQGKLAPLPGAPTAGGDPATGTRAQAADASRMPATAMREPGLPATAQAGAAAASRPLAGVVDPATAGLVQQQLSALDAGSAGWSGLVLPGMQARITVQEKPRPSDDEAGSDPEAGADWSTRLAVMLPRLGAVEARLVMRGDRLQVSLAAGAVASADELAAARQQLVDVLGAAGLTVESLQVAAR
jgi:hypothetical protein